MPPKSSAKLVKGAFNDFSGGLNTYQGQLSLAPNQSPSMLNVICFPGRVQYCGGWEVFSTLSANPDWAYAFYDSNGSHHYVVWAGGNVYDVISGVPIVIESAAYTVGQHIGAVDDNGTLYWSTQTVPLRFWTPSTASHGAVTQDGTSPPPASPFLAIYAGSLVAFGVKFGSSAYQANVFSWSAVNDFGNWNAANSQAVGPNNGFGLSFGIQFGIANIGVSPYRTLIVGRTDTGIYAYSGALGNLVESVINCPVGCRDGASAIFIPNAEALGTVFFLGTDGQFWETNGVTASPVSLPILPTLNPSVALQIIGNTNPRFYAGYNEKWQYYFCSVGQTYYAYKWDTKAWTVFQGWPTGPVVLAPDTNGIPAYFVASQAMGAFAYTQVALDGVNFNGSPPNVYYTTPYLHFGDLESYKEFDMLALFAYQTGTQYSVVGTSILNADSTNQISNPLSFTYGAISPSNYFTLNVSTLNGPNVLAPNSVAAPGQGTPQVQHGRLAVLSAGKGMLQGLTNLPERLRGTACQFTISYTGGTMDFEVIGLEVRYRDMGEYKRSGGLKYSAQAGNSTTSPYMPTLQ